MMLRHPDWDNGKNRNPGPLSHGLPDGLGYQMIGAKWVMRAVLLRTPNR
jgi:hypothetical protein